MDFITVLLILLGIIISLIGFLILATVKATEEIGQYDDAEQIQQKEKHDD